MLMALLFWCSQYVPLLITGDSVPRSFTCGNSLKGSMLVSCSHTLSHTLKSYTPASGTTSGAGSTAVIVGMWPFFVKYNMYVHLYKCVCPSEYSLGPDYNTCTLLDYSTEVV